MGRKGVVSPEKGGIGMNRTEKLLGSALVLALTNLPVWCPLAGLSGFAAAGLAVLLTVCFLAFNVVPRWRKDCFTRLGLMVGGEILTVVNLVTLTANLFLYLNWGFRMGELGISVPQLVIGIVCALLCGAVLAVNGFLRMLASSVQLGVRRRVFLLLLWWVPVLNVILLWRACRIVREEFRFETEKRELDRVRCESRLCATRYPIVLVHGVFFRDTRFFNYWGRVPAELIRNGARVYYGNQQSAASVADCAAELKERVEAVVRETGCGKVNLIAHSKGGLDCRWAVSKLGLAPMVATLTTINTPHRGCAFVDWLLQKCPPSVCSRIASSYNAALRRFGDKNPDFMAAVRDLTSARCREFNGEAADAPGVSYRSVGSRMRSSRSAPMPLFLTWRLVHHFDGDNDGLVGVSSMQWGDTFRMLQPPGRRGISHGDMIDLNRQNIRGFDVREFYVSLVRDLKSQGY